MGRRRGNKTRIEFYADLAAFEYRGRYYFIDIASFLMVRGATNSHDEESTYYSND